MPVVECVLESMKDPNATTILLTGRSNKFSERIEKILSHKNLVFDEFGYKPEEVQDLQRITTMQFKEKFVSDMVAKYSPAQVNIWEDRYGHFVKFKNLMKNMKLKSRVHFVPPIETTLPEAKEVELVQKLLSKYRPGLQMERFVSHCGVEVDKRSQDLLMEHLPKLEEYWRHRPWCSFIGSGPLEFQEEVKYQLGDSVTFFATKHGNNNLAFAVQMEGIQSPHQSSFLVIALRDWGTLEDAEKIGRWTPLKEKIEISGNVKNFWLWRLVV